MSPDVSDAWHFLLEDKLHRKCAGHCVYRPYECFT